MTSSNDFLRSVVRSPSTHLLLIIPEVIKATKSIGPNIMSAVALLDNEEPFTFSTSAKALHSVL